MTGEDAVSPVIGLMLILTILVSAVALLNATYIPGLKQQSEIDHLSEVEEAFMDISSDIERMIAFRDETMVRERLFLGGGEVIFSGLRSSGTLRIDPDTSPLTWMVYNDSAWQDFPLSQVSIWYQPIGNFWQNQGYVWHNGLVNVTKGERTTWLVYADKSDADDVMADYVLASSPVTVAYYPGGKEFLQNITLSPVCMIQDPQASFVSSNGVGTVTFHLTDETSIVTTSPEELGILIEDSVYNEFWEKHDKLFTEIDNALNCEVVNVTGIGGEKSINLTFSAPMVTLTVQRRNLIVGAS